ncbi:hypothetical protein PGTUg99_028867 [Puccinia graminis f. sp. tritici]|uniref:Uncharacterized protein n=1 Tax=Puccinia graminis f. sp. tritici TaxID=56615 RepID=A0A5B0P374_PUCGR|nr:hypothetical protein PGTUg99_028867 [Puccinia graminis f. sp. tritici]
MEEIDNPVHPEENSLGTRPVTLSRSTKSIQFPCMLPIPVKPSWIICNERVIVTSSHSQIPRKKLQVAYLDGHQQTSSWTRTQAVDFCATPPPTHACRLSVSKDTLSSHCTLPSAQSVPCLFPTHPRQCRVHGCTTGHSPEFTGVHGRCSRRFFTNTARLAREARAVSLGLGQMGSFCFGLARRPVCAAPSVNEAVALG